MIYNSFVLFPDQFLKPSYHISPFSIINEIPISLSGNEGNMWEEFCMQKWGNNYVSITESGRSAIYLALSNLNLFPDDYVTIVTPSQNKYISNCVTAEIEKFCKWNRVINEFTKCIFVIHEFGKPYEDIKQLKQHNLPIIEDCAYAFTSQNIQNNLGLIGDFIIYSLPKYFPIQLGGILVNKQIKIQDHEYSNYILNQLYFHLPKIVNTDNKRMVNYNYLKMKFGSIGLTERFTYSREEIPGVFIFKTPSQVNLDELKKHCFLHGIESSVFYGENAYFIPCHQNLSFKDLDYFFIVIKYFIENI
jgi:hypothetical protein